MIIAHLCIRLIFSYFSLWRIYMHLALSHMFVIYLNQVAIWVIYFSTLVIISPVFASALSNSYIHGFFFLLKLKCTCFLCIEVKTISELVSPLHKHNILCKLSYLVVIQCQCFLWQALMMWWFFGLDYFCTANSLCRYSREEVQDTIIIIHLFSQMIFFPFFLCDACWYVTKANAF